MGLSVEAKSLWVLASPCASRKCHPAAWIDMLLRTGRQNPHGDGERKGDGVVKKAGLRDLCRSMAR